MNENLRTLKEKANTLPTTPGVYIMKNDKKEIIYIGKAKSLKNRVTQYFGSDTNHTVKVRKMVQNVEDFEFILCDSEFEAFLLENSLIKQNQPKYNILLKDDKGYHYIKITDDKWKKILAVKQMTDDGEYIGPYNSGSIVRETVETAQKIYKLPTCNRSFDKPTKPCLNFHIGLCEAPCKGNFSLKDYLESVNQAVNFIKKGGAFDEEVKLMRQKMNEAAENLDFEYAARLRDRISAIEKIGQRQKVITSTYLNQDIIASVSADKKICFQVLRFKGGHIFDEEHFIFDYDGADKSELYFEFIRQFYNSNRDLTPRIVADFDVYDSETLERWLSEKCGKKVQIVKPKIGEQLKLVEMCRTNAAQNLSNLIERDGRETSAISELGDLLSIPAPKHIEAYDISNFSGSNNVAAMVVFVNGRPKKDLYRKFKIKSFVGQDDYRSMAEVIDRRLNEFENGSDSAFSTLPDLILLDGAQGQINAVLPILRKHSIDVPIFGMVKDSKHRTRAIAASGGDIEIKPTRRVYSLITSIQDEVHRFAISYNRNAMKKAMLSSELLNIEGVGKGRAKLLLAHFKSLEKIKNASVEELCSVSNISETIAKNIFEFYNHNYRHCR